MREAVEGHSSQEFSIQGIQRGLVGAQHLIRDVEERLVDQTEVFGQGRFGGVEVEQSRHVFFVRLGPVQCRERRHGVARVVLG